MIFIYALVGAIFALAFINPFPEAEYAIVIILAGYSTWFYWIVSQVLMGTKEMQLEMDGNISTLWQTRLVLMMSMYVVFITGYTEVFYYCLPYILMGTAGDIFATAMMSGFIEFRNRDED